MIRRFIRIAAATAVISALAMSAHAQTGKPLSNADKIEAQVLMDNYIMPIMNSTNSALAAAADDQPKACELARQTYQKAVELSVKTKALYDRLVREGKTTAGVDQLMIGAGKMVEGTDKTVRGLCVGAIKTGDPVRDAVAAKLMGLATRLTSTFTASIQAEQRNDHPTACAKLREADATSVEIVTFVKAERAKMADGSSDAAEADDMLAQIGPLQAQIKTKLETCPAA